MPMQDKLSRERSANLIAPRAKGAKVIPVRVKFVRLMANALRISVRREQNVCRGIMDVFASNYAARILARSSMGLNVKTTVLKGRLVIFRRVPASSAVMPILDKSLAERNVCPIVRKDKVARGILVHVNNARSTDNALLISVLLGQNVCLGIMGVFASSFAVGT